MIFKQKSIHAHKISSLGLTLAVFVFSVSAFAQSYLNLAPLREANTTTPSWNGFYSSSLLESSRNESFSVYKGEMSYWSNQFNQDVATVDGNKFNIDGNFQFHRKRPGDLERKVTFLAQHNDAGATQFSLQEAFLRNHFGRSEITIGRHEIAWSPVDMHWGFGFINNRVNFDFYDVGQEGLTGLSFNRDYRNGVKLHLFGSILYVPELNPALDIDSEKGTITSRSAWAKPPASSTRINNEDIPIKYKVDMPQLSEIVLRPSAGASLSYQTEHFKYEVFYLKKPENKITIGAEVLYVNQQESVFVNAKPQVYYHNVLGANVVYTNGKTQMYAASLSNIPDTYPDGNQVVTDYTKLETEKIREDYIALGFNRGSDKFNYSINYIARVSEYDKVDDILAQNPRWSQALNLRISTILNRFLSASADLKFDTITKDRIFMFQADYNFNRNMRLSAGLRVIGAEDGEKTYWSDYVANDALFSKLTYVF